MAVPKKANSIEYQPITSYNLTRDMSMYIGLIIPGILDQEVLRKTFQELIHQWPVLGGQLITKTNPYSLSTGSTVDFGSRRINKSISSFFPFDYHIPTTACEPTLHRFPGKDTLDHVFHYDNMSVLGLPPKNTCALRCTILNDATLLGFRFPHHLCDAQACYDSVQAYADLINGRPIREISLPPDSQIPLSSLIEEKGKMTQLSRQEEKLTDPGYNAEMTPFQFFLALISLLWVRVLRWAGFRDGIEQGYIRLPHNWVEKRRAEYQKEIDEATREGEFKLEISRNDTICAWVLHAIYSLRKQKDAPVTFSYIYNYRPNLIPSPQFYLHASAYNFQVFVEKLSELQKLSPAQIAIKTRRMVIVNREPSVVKDNLKFFELRPNSLFCPAPVIKHNPIATITSFTTFHFNELDFEGACFSGESKVAFTHGFLQAPFNLTIDPYIWILKDGSGGYWLRSILENEAWHAVKTTILSGHS